MKERGDELGDEPEKVKEKAVEDDEKEEDEIRETRNTLRALRKGWNSRQAFVCGTLDVRLKPIFFFQIQDDISADDPHIQSVTDYDTSFINIKFLCKSFSEYFSTMN